MHHLPTHLPRVEWSVGKDTLRGKTLFSTWCWTEMRQSRQCRRPGRYIRHNFCTDVACRVCINMQHTHHKRTCVRAQSHICGPTMRNKRRIENKFKGNNARCSQVSLITEDVL